MPAEKCPWSITRILRSWRVHIWDYLIANTLGATSRHLILRDTTLTRLAVEPLEDRSLLSITAITPAAFEGLTTLTAGNTPDSIASLKLDNGDKVLLVANWSGNSVSVLNPTTSSTLATLDTGSNPNGFAVGDFGNGHQDFAIANWSSNTISVFLGDGTGTFTSAGTLSTGSNPANEMAVADLSGDGKLDLVVANQGSANVSVFLGNGDGTFGAATDYAAGSGSQAVVVGDFFGDGRADIAVANANDGTVSFLKNNGSGGFASPVNIAVGSSSFYYYLAAGDLSEDGKPDVVLSDFSNNVVHVLTNEGSGKFSVTDVTVGSGPDAIALGDIAGSGHLDMIVSDYFDDGVTVLRGNGDGTFQSGVSISTGSGSGPNGVVLDDLNGDNNLDIATANQNTGSASVLLNTAVIGTAGKSLSNVVLARFSDTGGPASASAYTATINWGDSSANSTGTVVYLGNDNYAVYGPGHVYATSGSFSGTVSVDYTAPQGAISVPFAATIRPFTNIAKVTPPAFEGPTTIAAGDTPDSIASLKLDNGDKVFLVANFNGNSVSVVEPTTAATLATLATGSGPNGFAVGDFGNGHQDFAIANWSSNTISLFLGDGTGHFTSAGTLAAGTNPANEMAIADFNGDGKLDLAVANQGSATLSVFLGNGDGTFGAATNYAAGSGSEAVVVGDFFGNGLTDIAVANANDGTVSFFPNNGSGGFGTPANVSVGSGSFYYYLASGDLNADGKPDVILSDFSNNNLHILTNQGKGNFSVSSLAVGSGPDAVAVGDVTGSGHLDLVVSNYFTNDVTELLGNGDGTFQPGVSISTGSGSGPNGVVLEDFTGSGALSIATANQNTGNASVLKSTAIIGTAGKSLSNVVLARFSDVGGPASASAYTASINWGDGSAASSGTVVYLGNDQYQVTGPGHVYTTAGSYHGTVAVDYTTPAGAVFVPFTATIRPTGTISGSIFSDRNGDGSQSSGETGLGFWTVRLTDSTGAIAATTQTAADGTFHFSKLLPGTYTVQEVVRPGWTATTESGKSVVVSAGGTASVTLGDYQMTSIAGAFFSDKNADGQKQTSEPGVSGQTVELYTKTGSTFSSTPLKTTTTDSLGNYRFSDLPPLPSGTEYVVVGVLPDSATQTTPSLSTPNGVTLPDGRLGYVLPSSGGVPLSTPGGNSTISGTGTITVNQFNNSTPVTVSFDDGIHNSRTLDTLLTQFNATYTDNTGLSATFNTFCIDLNHDVAPGQSASVYVDGDLASGFVNASRIQYILQNYGTADLTSNPIQAAAVQLAIWDLSLNNHTPTTFASDGDGTYSSGDPTVFSVTLGSNPNVAAIATLTNQYLQEAVGATDSQGAWFDASAAGNAQDRGQSLWIPTTIESVGVTQSIQGTVWLDANGDGVHQTAEDTLGDVTVTLSGESLPTPVTTTTDSSGRYAFLGVAPGSYTVTFDAPDGYRFSTPPDGVQTIVLGDNQSATAVDAGLVNTGSTNTVVTADVNPAVYGQPVTFTATVTDTVPAAGIPTGGVLFIIDGEAPTVATLNTSGVATLTRSDLSPGVHTVSVTYQGNESFTLSTSAQLNETVNRAFTTTVVTPDAGGAIAEQTIPLEASVTVSTPGVGIPTGTVTFYDGAVPLGTSMLDGTGVAKLDATNLSAGSHTITAVYGGDTNLRDSSSDESPLSVRAATTTAFSTTADTTTFGQSVTFTATVAANSGTPTGTVTFSEGETILGTGTLDAEGKATFTTGSLAVGYHNVQVSYSGDFGFGPSQTSGDQTIDPAETQTQLAATWDASGSATLTATVSVGSGAGTPTGTIIFSDGDTNLGTGTLDSAGKATLSVSLPGTAYNLTASYDGDANFNPSTSVNAPPTAPDSSIRTDIGIPKAVNAGFSDPDGDQLDVTFTQPASGSVVYVGQDSFTYTPPDATWTGATAFTYTVRDGRGGVTTGTVQVRVSDPNSLAADLSGTTSPKKAVVIPTSFDSQTVTMTGFTQGTNGTVSFADGAFTYTPTSLSWTGTDTFTYTLTDGTRTDTGIVTVAVTPWPDLIVTPTADPSPADPNQTINFAATVNGGSGTGYTYAWDFGDNTDGVAAATTTHAYSDPGIYPATLTVTDSVGDSSTVPVEVAVRDVVTITGFGSVVEGAPPTAFTFTRNGTVGDLAVSYTVGGNPAATPDADYQAFDGVVVIPDGSNSVSMPLTTLRDNLVEGDEVVEVTVTDGSGYTAGTAKTAAITITDDPPVVTVAGTGNASEVGLAAGQFTFTRVGGDPTAPLTVRYKLGGSATEGSDYDALSGWVTFPAGQTTTTVDVTPRTDALVEGDETVEVTVDAGDGTTYLVGDAKTASISIADSPPTVRLAVASSADEKPEQGRIVPVAGVFEVARRGGDFYAPVTVPVSFGGTATPGVDYSVALATDISDSGVEYPNLPTSVMIPAATSAVYLRVTPKQDNVVEPGGETVVLTAGDSTAYATDSSNPATLTIADDPPIVTVDYWTPPVDNPPDTTSALEGATGNIVFRRSGGDPSQALSATYTVSGTATAGTDYQALSGTVTFPAGVTQQLVPIVTLTDAVAEGPETVVVTMNDGGANYQAGEQAITFTINDDSPVVSIRKTDDAAEPGTVGAFEVTRWGGDTSAPLTVYLQTITTAANAATEGVDYQALPTQIEFAPNEVSKTIQVVPIPDTTEEGDETVTLALSDGAYQTDESSAVVTIADDNSNHFFFSTDPSTVDEGSEFILSGTYTPTAALAAGSSYQMTIDWKDGTTPFTKLYTFDSPQTQVRFSAAHAYADDGIVSSNPVPQPGNETPSDQQPMVVTFTNVNNSADTVHGTATVTVKNVIPSDANLQVEVNPPVENGVPRPADDPRGVLVRLVVNVTDPGANDLHRAFIDWGDNTTTDVPYSRPGAISVYHTYEVGAEPGEIPGKRTYSIAAEVWDDDSTQPEDAATATTTVEVNEQAPALTIDGVSPAPVNEGSDVTLTGTLRNPGSAGTSGWQQVEINWGDGTPLERVGLFTWASKADYALGNPTSPTYSSALGFQATHKYKNDKPWNGQGTQPGYPVTATVVDANNTAPALNATATAVVNNVAPSNLKLHLVDLPSDAPTANSPQMFSLSVDFQDPGVLDPHTVTVKWGDGDISTFHVPAGTFTLDPNDDQFGLLRHFYHSVPTGGITVTVSDDGPAGNNSVSGKIAFKVLNEPQVLSGYYAEAQKVNSGTVVEEIIAFGNHLYDLVASKAKAFTDAVGDFVNQLKDLETTLRDLFSNSAPAFLDGLLSDPTGFSKNLMKAAEQGFTQFFNKFTQNVQDIVLNWVKNKIPADLAVTAADLPNLEPEAVAGFALKLMGLTRDDFIARMASAIGPDNAQLLVQAYDYVESLLASNDETAFINGLTQVFNRALNGLGNGGTVGNLLDGLNFATIKSDAISAIGTQVLNGLGPQVAVLAASFINPGVGSFKTLFKAGQWLVNNVQTVRGAVGVINTLAQQVNKIKAGDTDFVANRVEDALKALSTVGLDLAAQITGFNDIPTKVFTAIGSLRARVQAPIDQVLNTVVSAVKTQLNRILGSIGVGASTDYTGLIGNVITFKVGSETHRLWAVVSTGTGSTAKPARFILASNAGDLDAFLAASQAQARRYRALQPLVDAAIRAKNSALVPLAGVDAAIAKYKLDASGQGTGTPKQIAEQNAKLTNDFKTVNTTATALVNKEGPSDQANGEPTGQPVKQTRDLMLAACFVKGTPLLVPGGAKPIEAFEVGDLIMARSEFDPAGPVEAKVVEEVFLRTGRVLNLHLAGQVIGTTFEHPFFQEGHGWRPAGELQPGDRVATLSGEWVTVEEVFDTGDVVAVYNLRVADYHTYFVGAESWGFGVWSHNIYTRFGSGNAYAVYDLGSDYNFTFSHRISISGSDVFSATDSKSLVDSINTAVGSTNPTTIYNLSTVAPISFTRIGTSLTPTIAPQGAPGYSSTTDLGGTWGTNNDLTVGALTEPMDDPTITTPSGANPIQYSPLEIAYTNHVGGAKPDYLTVFQVATEAVKRDPHTRNPTTTNARWIPAEAPGIRIIATYRIVHKIVNYAFGPTDRYYLVPLQ